MSKSIFKEGDVVIVTAVPDKYKDTLVPGDYGIIEYIRESPYDSYMKVDIKGKYNKLSSSGVYYLTNNEVTLIKDLVRKEMIDNMATQNIYISTNIDTTAKNDAYERYSAKSTLATSSHTAKDAWITKAAHSAFWEMAKPKKSTTLEIGIKKVIFNNPATIVIWEDDVKTIVKRQKGERWDKEKGLAMAIVKRALGNQGNYCNTFNKLLAGAQEEKK